MTYTLGIDYICLQEVELREASRVQIQCIFSQANDREKETILGLLGLDYWLGAHIHDGKIIHDLFQPIIQVFGHAVLINRMVKRMIVEDLFFRSLQPWI